MLIPIEVDRNRIKKYEGNPLSHQSDYLKGKI